MKVSVITVCYNSSLYIVGAIDSVLSQSYDDIEYIVIDGASTDGTIEILNGYSEKIAHIISESDKGIYDAMNKGIALATGEVVGILNSDDFYSHAGVISDVVDMFKKNLDVDMVLGNVDFVSDSDLKTSVRFYSSLNFSPWKLRFGFMPAHPGAFIKKSTYSRFGCYRLGYVIAADFELFVRMLLVNKCTYVKFNQSVINMRVGGVSTAGFKNNLIATNEIMKALKENNIFSNVLLVFCRLPIKLMQNFLQRWRVR